MIHIELDDYDTIPDKTEARMVGHSIMIRIPADGDSLDTLNLKPLKADGGPDRIPITLEPDDEEGKVIVRNDAE